MATAVPCPVQVLMLAVMVRALARSTRSGACPLSAGRTTCVALPQRPFTGNYMRQGGGPHRPSPRGRDRATWVTAEPFAVPRAKLHLTCGLDRFMQCAGACSAPTN